MSKSAEPDVDLESVLIIATFPLWYTAFVLLFAAGALNDWRRNRAHR